MFQKALFLIHSALRNIKNEYIYGKKRECKKELVYRRCQG